jgi:hypothetical protein
MLARLTACLREALDWKDVSSAERSYNYRPFSGIVTPICEISLHKQIQMSLRRITQFWHAKKVSFNFVQPVINDCNIIVAGLSDMAKPVKTQEGFMLLIASS